MKKVVIIDDEVAGRQLIQEYLEDYPDLVVLGEANNGVDATKLINEFKPDLIFLDIQMPGMTGFDVLKHLDEIPQIIFSTAYDQYALKAFEVHAVDYLLKPYTKERFKSAIERLKDNKGVQQLTNSLLMDTDSYPDKILVQFNNKLVTLAVKEIIRIEAYGDYSKIVSSDKTYISNYGISQLEEKLHKKVFMRVHRSSIINIDKIKELHKYAKSYDVSMQNGDIVRVSRGYMDAIKKIIF